MIPILFSEPAQGVAGYLEVPLSYIKIYALKLVLESADRLIGRRLGFALALVKRIIIAEGVPAGISRLAVCRVFDSDWSARHLVRDRDEPRLLIEHACVVPAQVETVRVVVDLKSAVPGGLFGQRPCESAFQSERSGRIVRPAGLRLAGVRLGLRLEQRV